MGVHFNQVESGVVDTIVYKYDFHDLSKPLIVTFSPANISVDKVNGEYSSPWAFDFLRKKGLNVLSFSCSSKKNWYRSEPLRKFIDKLSKELPQFSEKIGYGSSMGAYAVSAYSNLLKLNRVLLINPISTLNRKLVPFETRFQTYARKFDWENGCFDGAKTKAKGFVVYDPLFHLDSTHAKRYKGLVKLKVPGVGHNMPVHLNKMGILQDLVAKFIDDKLDVASFHKVARVRRDIKRYYTWMLSDENVHLTEYRKQVILKYALMKKFRVIPKENHEQGLVSQSLLDRDKDSNTQVNSKGESVMGKFLDEFVSELRKSNEKAFAGLDDKAVSVLTRNVFSTLAKKIEDIPNGEKITIPGLGAVAAREVEKNGEAKRRVIVNIKSKG